MEEDEGGWMRKVWEDEEQEKEGRMERMLVEVLQGL